MCKIYIYSSEIDSANLEQYLLSLGKPANVRKSAQLVIFSLFWYDYIIFLYYLPKLFLF